MTTVTTPVPLLVPEGPRDATKLGECCQAMRVVLDRPEGNGRGLTVGTRINFKTGDTGDALVMQFRKGKKGEKFATVKGLFAWVRFCPFCGTPTEPQP